MRSALILLALVGHALAGPTPIHHPPVRRLNASAIGDGHGSGSGTHSGGTAPRSLPNTVVLDGQRMLSAFATVSQGGYPTELQNILAQADRWMAKGPWTVTSKTFAVPGGTPHDYASQAPYWWPANWDNPSSTETCPYVRRDGHRNPEIKQYTDRSGASSMMSSTYLLSLAWWYTDEPKYRSHAGKILRTWFLDEASRMTPHLQHAQIIPCKNTGRPIGIIDFSQQYTDVLDAVALLNTVHDVAWSKVDAVGFESWNREFLGWLTCSEFGRTELAAKNNHGTFAAMLIAGLAASLGEKTTAAQYLESQKARIDAYIAADGSQPLELKRTATFHYSTFHLVAYLRMVAIGRQQGIDVDLWGYQGPEGQSIPAAVAYILPAASGTQQWPHPDLHFHRFAAYDIVQFGADMGMASAKAILGQIEEPSTGGTWALSPAVQQLDSIGFSA